MHLFSRLSKTSLKTFLFLIIVGVSVTFATNTFAELELNRYGAPAPVSYDTVSSWCPNPADDHKGLASICGTVKSAQYTTDKESGIDFPNQPIPGQTIAIYEENLVSPTGMTEGKLTNLFSSTSTNEDGRYHLYMRRAHVPNEKVYIVYFCGDAPALIHRIDSWHSYYNYDVQINCPTALGGPGEDHADVIPAPVPFEPVLWNSNFLACDNNPIGDKNVGLSGQYQPTVNLPLKEDNYDHRYSRNVVNISLPEIPYLGSIGLNFSSPGGLWEPDCLLRGDNYICNVAECKWSKNDDHAKLKNQQSPLLENFPSIVSIAGGYGLEFTRDYSLIDGTVCEDYAKTGTMWPIDKLTRPFFIFIPKTTYDIDPYRRWDMRMSFNDLSKDPLQPLEWIHRAWGSVAGKSKGSPHVFFRFFRQEEMEEPLIPCEELRQRNVPGTTGGQGEVAVHSDYLNMGPLQGMFNPLKQQELYYGLAQSGARNLRADVCLMEDGRPVKLCEIQPPWMGGKCTVGQSGCFDPDFNCGNYKLDTTYWANEFLFPTGPTQIPTTYTVKNDSMDKGPGRDELFEPLGQEGDDSPTLTEVANKNYSGDEQTNSYKTMYAITNPGFFTGTAGVREGEDETGELGTESGSLLGEITYPLRSPYCPFGASYEEDCLMRYVDWEAQSLGGGQLIPHCGLAPVYSESPVEPKNELWEEFHPENLFEGNPHHRIKHRGAGNQNWYLSEDAVLRDFYLREWDTVLPLSWYPVGLSGSSGLGGLVEIFFARMYGRDVWDSALGLIGGDTKLHDFQLSLVDVVQTAIKMTRDSEYKNFGDRDQTLPKPNIRPFYVVKHPLSEENFGDYFEPVKMDCLECVQYVEDEPIIIEEPIDPDDPALPGIPEDPGVVIGGPPPGNDPHCFRFCWSEGYPGCYEFDTPVPQGQICGTYKEPAPQEEEIPVDEALPGIPEDIIIPDEEIAVGVSRTCRLDECYTFQWLIYCACAVSDEEDQTGTWACNALLIQNECKLDSVLWCTERQETTLMVDLNWRGSNHEVPHDFPSDPTVYYKKGSCDRGDEWSTSEPVPPSRQCISTVAGPLKGVGTYKDHAGDPGITGGGSTCNGTLEIVDPALRNVQAPHASESQLDLDKASYSLLAAYIAQQSPFRSGVVNQTAAGLGQAGTTNLSGYDDAPMPVNIYAGALMPVPGANNPRMSNISTTPIETPGERAPLNNMGFHCDLKDNNPKGPGWTPKVRGIVDLSPYEGYDPELGYDSKIQFYDPQGRDELMPGGPYADHPGPSWLCVLYNPPNPQTAPIKGGAGGGKCGLSSQEIKLCEAHERIPENLSQNFIDTLNFSANLVEVPVGALYAVIAHEGGFNLLYNRFWANTEARGEYLPYGENGIEWDDPYRWSAPWFGRIDFGGPAQCNELVWSAQGPYQILLRSWELFMDDGLLCNLLNGRVSQGRCNTASRCNLLDSSIMAALHLADASGCEGGYNFTNQFEGYSGGDYTADSLDLAKSVFAACSPNFISPPQEASEGGEGVNQPDGGTPPTP